MKSTFLTIAFAAFATMVAPQAQGSTSYALTVDNCTGSCGTSPFGTINLQQLNSTDVQVTVTLFDGNQFANSAGEALAFNIDPAVGAIAVPTITAGYSLGSGGFSKNPLGTFSNFIHCDACGSGGSNPQPGPLVFTVRATGLLEASFIAADPEGNLGAFYFVSDIISGTTGNTGNVAAPGGTVETHAVTPEPVSMSLVGAGLLAIGLWKRKNRRTA